MKLSFISILLLVASFSVQAQVEPTDLSSNDAQVYSTHSWYFGAGQYQLDDGKSRREGVENDALYLSGGYQWQRNGLLIGAGISALTYDDNEEFTEEVESRGYRYDRDSDALGYGLFGQLGYSFALKPDRTLSLDLLGGYERIWSERSISFCDDCREEDIDIEGGAFARLSLRWIISQPFTLSLNLKQFFSESVDTGVDLTFGWTVF